jgi:hypothetical protein
MALNHDRLVKEYSALCESRGEPAATETFREVFTSKAIHPGSVDLGSLFEACFGVHEFRACRAGGKDYLATNVMERALTEAEGAVATSAFMNITGQIVYSTIMDAYSLEETVFQKLIPEVPTKFLHGEKIPGVNQIGDEAAFRPELQPYGLAGFGEDWVFTPPLRDTGMVVPVSWEAVFADRTNLVLTRAKDVGRWVAQNKEKRAIDMLIDENVTAHRYNWRGTVIATYGDNAGAHTWDNLAASNALEDWTDINTAVQLLNQMTDPYTGEPAVFEAKHLVVTKQLEQTARRIIRAGEIRVTVPGYATTGTPTQTVAPNPYSNAFELVTSRLLAARLATDTSWFLGDVTKIGQYMVAEPLTVTQAPPNAPEEFHRRVVAQFRANEYGAYTTVQPRAVIKSTA